ncbi:Coiled-coil and C2 domain-containing protein 1-like [Caenorhabditis elegans]|uniref:Coiled-coil and C2 domain-containing protein 1-like n=1 Tax=Caenorhabditis elegans TaxID=6239 RepID=C2D1_CAEEL|nr:Coiled-coil and C2 domain-containing protein 1-like [Caenorhabditis elegans]Q9U2M8.3 RecName: Full=Coiled-coil and C2 domain-containing protein 1-like [Caenorhabditis elegans]CAB63350.3 Coiled-coil and C2 domain-containing protein 1-like [Caenorhabditis elegans]
MNFNDIDNQMYGNLEEDAELLAELAAIQEEEMGRVSRPAAPARGAPPAARGRPAPAAPANVPGLDPRLLAAALADNHGDGGDEELEMDEDLLNELNGLVGGGGGGGAAPTVPTRAAPRAPGPSGPPPSASAPNSQLGHLKQLHVYYMKAHKSAEQAGEGPKARRYKRAVDKLVELIRAVERGKTIDESEIPVAPPNFSSAAAEPLPPPAPTAQPAHHPPAPPIRQAAHAAESSPPPIPQRKSSAPAPTAAAPPATKEPTDPKKAAIYRILHHRRDLHKQNARAAIADKDKESAKESVEMAKAFDQAIAALNECSADEMDMNDVPPSPPPYRKPAPPQPQAPPTSAGPLGFIEELQQRQQRFQKMAEKAKTEGNERKMKMNMRLAGQFDEAIKEAKRGKLVNVGELPSLPDMGPLPPQTAPGQAAPKLHQRPPPQEVGPLAPSGVEGKSRNQGQLEFLLERQAQFKQAAIHAKSRGDVEAAKKYLVEMKGFDKMIQAAQAGLPVSIKATPIPPQAQTASTTLQPRIQSAAASSSTGVENRGEKLSLLEKTLIEQVRSAETNQMRFTRLGDVGKVRLFEGWGKVAKQDLLLVREVAKRGLQVPKFHYEMRQIPSADLFPDLADDVIELTIVSCRDVPLPSGYETHHANLFIKYTFPAVVNDLPQTGKTKLIAGTASPDFGESIMLNIGSGKSRNSKLQRTFKRGGLKFEVFQKGGFMRSDKLLGTCEWKLEKLEHSAEMEESLPLKDGRKAVGGLLSAKVRIRQPIGDAKAQHIAQKWLILDN